MKIKLLKYLFLIILLLPSCRKEKDNHPDIGPDTPSGWTSIHFQATASGSNGTKATLDAFDRRYVFERDDLLYVVDKETGGDRLYGFLFLISGAGAYEAIFEGDLMFFDNDPSSSTYKEPQTPDAGFEITGTLVSQAQRSSGFFTTVADNDGKLASGPAYNPSSNLAATFKEAVQQYGYFKADATFGAPSFSLSQQTAFLLFTISFEDDVTGNLDISVKNKFGEPGETTLFTHTQAPDANHAVEFVAAFRGGSVDLDKARLVISDGDSFDATLSLKNATIQANRYYNVTKSIVDLTYFTIMAREAADITFNFTDADHGLQYSSDGVVWTDVSSSPISLSEGAYVKIRGKGTGGYRNSDGSTPLFSSTGSCYVYGDIMSLFYDGTYTTKSSGLPANAFQGAFKGMSNLDIHPARSLHLSATTLANYCYSEMFSGSGITRAPELTGLDGSYASTIPEYACQYMFKDCTALTAANELPATTVGHDGYCGMFAGCTAMVTPPTKLAATLEGTSSFRRMFLGCSSLLYAPELPATQVRDSSYRAMFSGCTSLLEAPDLPATIIGRSSYFHMFGAATIEGVSYQGCRAMTAGPSSLPATTMKPYCYQEMFKGCVKLEEAPSIAATGTLANSCFMEMFSDCSVLANAQASFAFTEIETNSCRRMFYNCLALNSAPQMPSVTRVNTSGCNEMYAYCGQLLNPPSALNATNIGNCAYYRMFAECVKITSIPTFPTGTVTLAANKNCYEMFLNCSSITSLEGRQLFSAETILQSESFRHMFKGCSSLGGIVPKGFLPSTNLAASCYRGMFQDTAITEAPDLPATTLKSECYRWMFNGCTNLNSIRCLGNPGGGSAYTNSWMDKVAASGTFVKASGASWASGINGIPSGWTVTSE